jgi:hypothetical protein
MKPGPQSIFQSGRDSAFARYLEDDEKLIELLSGGTLIEASTAGI